MYTPRTDNNNKVPTVRHAASKGESVQPHTLVNRTIGDRQIKLPLRGIGSESGRARTQSRGRSAAVSLGTPFVAVVLWYGLTEGEGRSG